MVKWGFPSMVKGAGLKMQMRNPVQNASWVQIPPPTLKVIQMKMKDIKCNRIYKPSFLNRELEKENRRVLLFKAYRGQGFKPYEAYKMSIRGIGE